MTLAAMLADLPRACDVGAKRNAKGFKETWIGYKLHLDTADGEIPISCVLTAASVHDSRVAIPLATITAGRVTAVSTTDGQRLRCRGDQTAQPRFGS